MGTQSGTIDVIDVSANAVSVSFAVHSSVVRGLRWLGNSRLVSFSYSQVTNIYNGSSLFPKRNIMLASSLPVECPLDFYH